MLPAVAVGTETGTEVLDESGTAIRSFGPFQFYSLAGSTFAGSGGGRGDTVIAYDAVTGSRRFTIRNAFGPVVLGSGRVAFLPDRGGRRDPWNDSLWIRARSGSVRVLARFAVGPGAPGIQTNQPDAGAILGLAFDAAGRKVAIAHGNDVDLFFYDVWVVKVGSGTAFRATRGNRSRFPSLSPDGSSLAFLRERVSCGGPPPGFRAGDLMTIPARKGGRATVLLPGSCALFYTEPRWLSNGELVAVRLSRTAPGEYRNDLVLVDAGTGALTVLDASGDVFGLSVSFARRLVAFMHLSGGSTLYDVDAGTGVGLADAFAPKLSGDRAWP